jgi:hypothetical protein
MDLEGKHILDVTCGSRSMWFDKNNPNTIFTDMRVGTFETTGGRVLQVNPDYVMDFRKLQFDDCSFNLVVFDPPHRKDLTKGNWMEVYYTNLFPIGITPLFGHTSGKTIWMCFMKM